MKKKLINFSISLLSAIILGFVMMVIVTLLSRNNIINQQVNDNIVLVISFILFFAFGFFFAFKEKKRGFLNGLLLVLLYLILAYGYLRISNQEVTFSKTMTIVGRSLLLLSGSVLGVNLASRNNQD